MKRIILQLSFLIFLSAKLCAQEYNVYVSNETYTDLSNPISVNQGLTWDEPEYSVPIGFTFEFFDIGIENLNFDFTDNVLYSNLDYDDPKASFIVTGLDITDRAHDVSGDEAQPGSLSPISYQVTGNTGSRIFKLEWKNAGIYDDISENGSSSDFINFQLWLYEGSGDIEYRFGDNDLTEQIAIYAEDGGILYYAIGFDPFFNYQFGNSPEGLALSGDDPTNPVLEPINMVYNGLEGPIPSGTVYRFSTMVVDTDEILSNKGALKITPNPITHFLNLETSVENEAIEKIQIIDANGRTIKTVNGLKQIDVAHLVPGYYSVRLITTDGILVDKFIKI